MLAAVETYPEIPVVMHQHHGTPVAVCQQSMRSGFTSVMMDGSLATDGKTPSSYEHNLNVTRRVYEMALAVGVSVEFDHRKALIAAHKAAAGICKLRFEAFGCTGMCSKIKPIHLDVMAARYA